MGPRVPTRKSHTWSAPAECVPVSSTQTYRVRVGRIVPQCAVKATVRTASVTALCSVTTADFNAIHHGPQCQSLTFTPSKNNHIFTAMPSTDVNAFHQRPQCQPLKLTPIHHGPQ